MHIERIGFTPLKGARHVAHDQVLLREDGPVGDRVFCLVDPARARVLRTVENPTLVQTVASWADGVLSVDLPDGTVVGRPAPTGDTIEVDYWGRTVSVEVQDGPWAEAFSGFLGHEVVLTRAGAGEVVYGAAVTVVSTSTLRHLGEQLGHRVDGARFRSTLQLDTGDAEAHVEDSWAGGRLRVGDATLELHQQVPRCAVVDSDPETGRRDRDVLRTVAGYRRENGEIHVGMDARVVAAGTVRTGDTAELERV